MTTAADVPPSDDPPSDDPPSDDPRSDEAATDHPGPRGAGHPDRSPTEGVRLGPSHEIPIEHSLPKALHVAHVGAHDVEPPHELTPIERFDDWVDQAFDHIRGTEPADRIFYAVTELADFSLLWLLIATARAAADDRQVPNAVRVGAILMAESLLVNAGIKSIFKRERPVVQVERPYNLRVPLTTSFPSGHSSAAAVAAVLLSDRSRAKPVFVGLAILVATSRVYVRIHHASDVVGGLVLGTVLGTIAKAAWPLDPWPETGTRHRRRRFGGKRRTD